MALTISVDTLAPHTPTNSLYQKRNDNGTVQRLHLNANLCFEAKRCTAIMGHSGAGKTSLLRCIAGLDHYPDAHVQLESTIFQSNHIFIPPHIRRIGIVFQHHNLFDHLSVINNLRYALHRTPNKKQKLTLDNATNLFHIKHLLNKMPQTLSGGEKQMVALARTALTAPRILLLDEPFSNIDSQSKALMIQSIKDLCDEDEIPVIFVTHDFGEVAQLADDVVVMNRGTVEAAGSLFEITSDLHHALAKRMNAAVVIESVVQHHEEKFGLTKAALKQQSIYIKHTPNKVGSVCRIRIAAKDVSICLNRPEDSSILNILPVTIEEILSIGNTHVLLRLDLDGQHLLSRITLKSSDHLQLSEGQRVYAQIKSVALATDFD